MSSTITWSGTLTALSSISQGGESRGLSTMLRREQIFDPDSGVLVPVPIISGNSFRGILRRIGEDQLRDVLDYDGKLSAAAAHALRGGGTLAKVNGEPLSGSRLATLRRLVPQIGVFGAAGGGRIIEGCLQVGKVVPHLRETRHITGVNSTRSSFDAAQIETYTRVDDSLGHSFVAVDTATGQDPTSQQMLYRIETYPAGTTFSTWLSLTRPTDLEIAFFVDILDTFAASGALGGRKAIGLGRVRTDLTCTAELPDIDWRALVAAGRDQALAALEDLA
ncbi:RAMP superfamily CRISPR-associated protein [Luteococcus sp.]|uniref:RAMP superfamily CRISPR-associated protein n=1 Tax=Luteococcus sp. TaxID=1969402 RepID=UPI003736BE71